MARGVNDVTKGCVVLLLLSVVSAIRRPQEEHALPGWKGEAELLGNQVVYGKARLFAFRQVYLIQEAALAMWCRFLAPS